MTLTLSDEEQEALSQALAHYLDGLRAEIHHTDDRALKVRLQRHQHLLQGLALYLDSKRSSP